MDRACDGCIHLRRVCVVILLTFMALWFVYTISLIKELIMSPLQETKELADVIREIKSKSDDHPNIFVAIAAEKKRDYIMPEDVSEALELHPHKVVMHDLLGVLGKQFDLYVEDPGLAAFIAWNWRRPISQTEKE